jgi:hypothetical protein
VSYDFLLISDIKRYPWAVIPSTALSRQSVFSQDMVVGIIALRVVFAIAIDTV